MKTAPLPGYERIDVAPGTTPLLFVIVDTEEEFDWGAPFSRTSTGVAAMRRVGRLQSTLTNRGVTPTYVVDYPVASQRDGFAPLKEFADSGIARIGAHLHPWVNPPFVEEVTRRNSFACTLGEPLETEKIRVLRSTIAESFGRVPVVYKAGRYGFGPTTASALEALGFTIDVSVNPRMDFSSEGGPSFSEYDTAPFFFGRRRALLEIPCSTDYTGIAGRFARRIHDTASRPVLERIRVPGVMAHLGVVNRIMLSPENSTLGEMKALTASLLRRSLRTFSLTLHSPSVEAGRTPYTRTDADVSRLLDRVAAYCDFFLGELGGRASTPEEFYASWQRDRQELTA